MINRIHDYMIHNKMIEEGGCILAAVSGGADSMCLLEILRELRTRAGFQLRVLHVHHGLREMDCGRARRGILSMWQVTVLLRAFPLRL